MNFNWWAPVCRAGKGHWIKPRPDQHSGSFNKWGEVLPARLSGYDDKPLVPPHNTYTYSVSKFRRTLKNAHTVRTVWWSISNSKSHYPHYFCSLLVNCITSSRQNPSASVVNFISEKRWREWIVRYLQYAIHRTERHQDSGLLKNSATEENQDYLLVWAAHILQNDMF